MPWAKVNYLCHLLIFICAASENVCAMRKSIYNHTCVLNFVNVMCEFMHDMRYLIRCMFSFICDMSQFIKYMSILLCTMYESIHVVSENPLSIFLHPVWYIGFARWWIRAQNYMWPKQNYKQHWQIHLLTFGDRYYWVSFRHEFSLWSFLHEVPYVLAFLEDLRLRGRATVC